jgi:maleate isomerase
MQISSTVSVAVGTARPMVGLLGLGEDRVVVGEMGAYLSGEGVEVVASRVGMPVAFTLDGFRSMDEAFLRGAKSLSRRCALVAVACASAAVAIGPARFSEMVKEGIPEAEVVEPITAYLESLDDRSVKRIALVTPYAIETHAALSELFEERGVTVSSGLRLQVPEGHVPSDVAPASILDAVRHADHGEVEGIVLSCTALPTAHLLDDLEADLQIPVVSTNLALSESITRRLGDLSRRPAVHPGDMNRPSR